MAPLVALCAATSAIGLTAYRTDAAAIVGEPRALKLSPTDRAPAAEQIKADYRRPATIPFPKDNP